MIGVRVTEDEYQRLMSVVARIQREDPGADLSTLVRRVLLLLNDESLSRLLVLAPPVPSKASRKDSEDQKMEAIAEYLIDQLTTHARRVVDRKTGVKAERTKGKRTA